MGRPVLKTFSIEKPNIVLVLVREGIALTQKGRTFWACCPLHGEKTPSFKVDTDRQIFYCFGCHRHGDVIAFIMERHGLSFKDSCRYLGLEQGRPGPARIIEDRERKELRAAFRQWENEQRAIIAPLLRAFRWMELKGLLTARDKENLTFMEGVYEVLCRNDDHLKYELFREDYDG